MIINSLLDQDFYKYTMANCIFHQFPNFNVVYTFKCRNKSLLYEDYIEKLSQNISHLCTLKYSDDELNYLRNIPYLSNDFIDFLSNFKLNSKNVNVKQLENKELGIEIKGNWINTIWWEVPLLAIINELHSNISINSINFEKAFNLLETKATIINYQKIKVSDFGTRRRFSRNWHEKIIEYLSKNCSKNYFIGTSNVELAKKYNIKPIGTMAHEFIMACQQANVKLIDFQKYAFQKWIEEYRGNLGIALTDTIGIDAFLIDFDLYFAKLYDGVRQDSGNPFIFGDKIIEHYKKLKIDPMTKTIVFSDKLNFILALELKNKFYNKINVVFGIGTNITNDIPWYDPLNTVIKLTEVNGQPVAKISDSMGKGMCNNELYVKYLKNVFNVHEYNS